MARARISGLKHRQELCLLLARGWPWDGLTTLSRALSLAAVNLPFLLAQAEGKGTRAGFCLERDRRHAAQDAADALSHWFGWPRPEVLKPVATVSLYPLGGGLALPAQALACLGEAGLRPLALGTSPATLTLVLPQEALPRALEALAQRFDTPPEASPPHERVKVAQSAQWRGR